MDRLIGWTAIIIITGLVLIVTGVCGPVRVPGVPGNPPVAPTPVTQPVPPPSGGNAGQPGGAPKANVRVQVDGKGRWYLPDGDPAQPYSVTITIPNGMPAPTCFNGVEAHIFDEDNNRLGGGGNRLPIRGVPGKTYTVNGGGGNGGFDWKPSC